MAIGSVADVGETSSGVARPIQSVGIVGAGMMGVSIVAVHLRHGLPVVIDDSDQRALDEARERIVGELMQDMAQDHAHRLANSLVHVARAEKWDSPHLCKAPTGRAPTEGWSRQTGTVPFFRSLGACDLVVESIAESPPAKQQLYARLETELGAHAVWASNTSTIPIGRLAARMADPGRFCGFHFCHPVRSRPLVEVIRGPKTSDGTIAAVVAHAEAIGKIPVVVEDGPGFLINRLLVAYLGEALDLLLEGATVEQIDEAMSNFGMAMGPFELMDEIGLDTVLQAAWVLAEAFGERIVRSPLLVGMIKAGRLGRKSAAGFSQHEGQGAHDPLLTHMIAQWARPPKKHSARSIQRRLLLPMVLEATRILMEGKVRDARDIDLAVLFGLGFPATQGGLLGWADRRGAKAILRLLRPLAELGPRAEPTPLLEELARSGRSFYAADLPIHGRGPSPSGRVAVS